jgi:hypothetical protein
MLDENISWYVDFLASFPLSSKTSWLVARFELLFPLFSFLVTDFRLNNSESKCRFGGCKQTELQGKKDAERETL